MNVRNEMLSIRMKNNNPMKNKETVDKVKKKITGLLVGEKNPAKKLEIRKKISKTLNGHFISLETRRKISNNLMGRFIGEKNPFFGRHHTTQVREKSRLRAIKQLISGSFKNKETSIEIKLEKEFLKINIVYKKQWPLLKLTVVDFYLPSYKIVIYADGDFWHKSNWAKNQGTIEKDENQNKILAQNSYKVFRFSEFNINRSASRCIDKVVNYKQ